MKPFHLAAEGKLGRPFVLVVEDSIPNEKLAGEGFWAGLPVRHVARGDQMNFDPRQNVDEPPAPDSTAIPPAMSTLQPSGWSLMQQRPRDR